MHRIAVIATHHKAGTVWMNHTFRKVGEAFDIPVVNAGRDAGATVLAPPIILCAANSIVSSYPDLLERGDVRSLHVVRDPRDMLISAMHYHRLAEEKWLQRPRDEFGGQSYREALNAHATERARYAFEMDNAIRANLRKVVAWDRSAAHSLEVKYEDLAGDRARDVFAAAAAHLGFGADEISRCVDIFRRLSIFGGKAEQRESIGHVRSGQPEQWRGVFDRALGRAFADRFGPALAALGYETDDSWIDALPAHMPALDAA